MIYYRDEKYIIRTMNESDPAVFASEETAQGWHSSEDKFKMRLRDMNEGKCIPLVAELYGERAGYINVYPDCKWDAFGGKGYPEIVDFGVLEKFRRQGVGSKLMDIAEQIAAEHADTVYLGVGLHSGYGSAQRMYVKRGYIPDGSGVWYGDKICPPYAECKNDDELNLYLSKKLTSNNDQCRKENL